MVTERQVIAILTVIGSFVALSFAIYNLVNTFRPNNSTFKGVPSEIKR